MDTFYTLLFAGSVLFYGTSANFRDFVVENEQDLGYLNGLYASDSESECGNAIDDAYTNYDKDEEEPELFGSTIDSDIGQFEIFYKPNMFISQKYMLNSMVAIRNALEEVINQQAALLHHCEDELTDEQSDNNICEPHITEAVVSSSYAENSI